MSDEFDKEAEREKLREKFADDEEKRSATQRMSELLLQGATMTNKHCDNCGDPLFRDNGQTFCPTCGDAEAEAAEQSQAPDDQPAPESQPQSNQEPRRVQEAGVERQADQGRAADAAETPAAAEAEATAARTAAQLPEGAEVIGRADEQDGSPQQPVERGTPQPTERGAATSDPRAELRRAVTETARNATGATDPRTAKAWLEASKEAAEALAALER
ncbi:MAG: Sjogren's syndrome/scleroderma autoantigen 1 family protein [Halolamina sp.]|uniref:Sjogren's syndrome/scleroderma autoantigen 1 family protein n=1 Tax=Halolamina sp. TaxID=1940283 RepID=UPI002FC2CAE7